MPANSLSSRAMNPAPSATVIASHASTLGRSPDLIASVARPNVELLVSSSMVSAKVAAG
jgi:hypothetical protein